ncbi:hypothetical protein BJI67_16070 (plasmid) [Acidihalobacter aeolianus]|uniref:Uncharacterized protein n=1 Tax=Acidihalobacter aeolianus TaxID=2792603 RepID=A0A1D8KCR7_9GAMM|nr:hypothetical protein BJI67_16070 [Acidihalobacter aeolianus]
MRTLLLLGTLLQVVVDFWSNPIKDQHKKGPRIWLRFFAFASWFCLFCFSLRLSRRRPRTDWGPDDIQLILERLLDRINLIVYAPVPKSPKSHLGFHACQIGPFAHVVALRAHLSGLPVDLELNGPCVWVLGQIRVTAGRHRSIDPADHRNHASGE